MSKDEILEAAANLVERSSVVLIGTAGTDGFPQIKALSRHANDGIRVIWMMTGSETRKIEQLRRDNRAALYFLDPAKMQGLMLEGTVELLSDINSRRRVWKPALQHWYPGGPEDPNFRVLKFTAARGNFSWGIGNADINL